MKWLKFVKDYSTTNEYYGFVFVAGLIVLAAIVYIMVRSKAGKTKLDNETKSALSSYERETEKF